MHETIEIGSSKTPFMDNGNTVKIYMNDKDGKSIFGEIFNTVKTSF